MTDLSVDRGMAELTQRFRVEAGGGEGVQVESSLEAAIGRLARALDRRDRREQELAQGIAPITLPPIDFTVTAGSAKYKSYRAAATDCSPQEGFVWFVTRLTLSGLNAGDLVNLYKTVSSTLTVNASALHLFTGPASVGAGLGVADWEPGVYGCRLFSDESFHVVSAGTLAATEIVLTGEAIQVADKFVAEFLF